jgi:hypothetical protein
MKTGIGFSREKDADKALAEAYRKSLKGLGATRAEFILLFYSYDYALDQTAMSGALKHVFRDVPHFGCSTWGAWSSSEAFEAETGVLVVSMKDLDFEWASFKIHSLREKAELWSTELSRQIEDRGESDLDALWILADSLTFAPGQGFGVLERRFPKMQVFGMGASFSVPQCSVVAQGEVYLNALIALGFRQWQPWLALLQSVAPEGNKVKINRMSENLVIEIDEKPAFYKLSEHLMTIDDLPMMSQDEFRKHMGNLYVVEEPALERERTRVVGRPYRPIALLGSEMTTGMVAVAQPLDFSCTHYLGQKKAEYSDAGGFELLEKVKEQCPQSSLIFVMSHTSRLKDKERQRSDTEMIRQLFPNAPVVGIATNGEYLGISNQFSSLVWVWP